jgi:hypothetical protein
MTEPTKGALHIVGTSSDGILVGDSGGVLVAEFFDANPLNKIVGHAHARLFINAGKMRESLVAMIAQWSDFTDKDLALREKCGIRIGTTSPGDILAARALLKEIDG